MTKDVFDSIAFNDQGNAIDVFEGRYILWVWDNRIRQAKTIESFRADDNSFNFYLGNVSDRKAVICKMTTRFSGSPDSYLLFKKFEKSIQGTISVPSLIQYHLAIWAMNQNFSKDGFSLSDSFNFGKELDRLRSSVLANSGVGILKAELQAVEVFGE